MTARLEVLSGPIPPLNYPATMTATLMPNRSLSRGGYALIMAVVIGVSVASGALFLSLGAWPVIGFFGLDILLVWLAFKLNYQSGAKQREFVRVCPERIIITQRAYAKPEKSWTVSPHFARVVLNDISESENSVMITAGGNSLGLGHFLSPTERRQFASALEDAIKAARRFRWDQAPSQ